MKAALVIMAAGMGSRYGGSKQVDGIGPDGEILMEYSIYDAIRAGFTKVVFIIKPEMRELVETLCGRRVAGMTAVDGSPVEVCYAYQDFSSVPAFYSIPAERTKPFGTGHAVLCARSCVGEPFIVINADDYYSDADTYWKIYLFSGIAVTDSGKNSPHIHVITKEDLYRFLLDNPNQNPIVNAYREKLQKWYTFPRSTV